MRYVYRSQLTPLFQVLPCVGHVAYHWWYTAMIVYLVDDQHAILCDDADIRNNYQS